MQIFINLTFDTLDCNLLTEKLTILNPRVATRVILSSNHTHTFNPILMNIRSDVFHQILDYRRKSLHFPSTKELQLALVLKFYVIEFRRRIWPLETDDYVKNHLAGITVLENLFSAHLLSMKIDFAGLEGWDIHSRTNSRNYCFNDEYLNDFFNKS